MQFETGTERRLLRALVAEDDPGVRQLIVALLQLDGWDVRATADADEAIAIAGDWHPDAVVMDVMMPGTDGLTAVRAMRAAESERGGDDSAVVVVSAKAGVEDEARDAGADDFVAKPFEPDDLSARAKAAVRWRAGAVSPR